MFLSKIVAAFERFNRLVKAGGLPDFDAAKEKQLDDLYRPYLFRNKKLFRDASDFLDLLLSTSHLKASEPRDRVFSLLSVAEMHETGQIQVNYSTTLPELCRSVARYLLDRAHSSHRALTLALPATLSASAQSSSTWAPDFGALTSESLRKRTWYSQQPYRGLDWAWGFSSAPPPPNHPDSHVWHWKGVFCDRVDQIVKGSNIPILPSTASLAYDLVQFARKIYDQYLACLTFARQVRAFSRQEFDSGWLFRQRIAPIDRDPNRQTLEKAFEIALKENMLPVESSMEQADIVSDLCGTAFTEGISYMDHSRLLASTTGGRVGWVPNQATIGDHVCILEGFPAPFIIRELDSRYYAIVGDACIEGIMEGQAWPKDEKGVEILKFK